MMTRLCSDQTTRDRRQITRHCLLIMQGMSVKTFTADHEPLSGTPKKLKLNPPLNGQSKLSLHGKLKPIAGCVYSVRSQNVSQIHITSII